MAVLYSAQPKGSHQLASTASIVIEGISIFIFIYRPLVLILTNDRVSVYLLLLTYHSNCWGADGELADGGGIVVDVIISK